MYILLIALASLPIMFIGFMAWMANKNELLPSSNRVHADREIKAQLAQLKAAQRG